MKRLWRLTPCNLCGLEMPAPCYSEICQWQDDSAHAAWLIFEDCRERGQSEREAFRKAIQRLIPRSVK